MAVTVRLFAILKERRGVSTLTVDLEAGESVQALYGRLFPDLRDGDRQLPVLYAVGDEYVPADHVVADGATVVFIPPLGGGSGLAPLRLTEDPLELEPVLALVAGPGRGGICSFVGTVRDHFEGRPVRRLLYEAYEEMALAEMARLRESIRGRWPDVELAMHHRLGVLEIGEAAVIVVAAAPHRDDAFAACRAGIDELKERVPIWKKEIYADGSEWKANVGGTQRGPSSGGEPS